MVSKVKALFERLLRELPLGAASLDIHTAPGDGGATVGLRPSNPAAASFGVHCDDYEIYSFSFGSRSQWEFPYERRYRNGEKDIVEEVEEMSRAVMAGDCEEKLGWLSLKGSISVGDYTYKVTNLPVLSRRRFRTRRYASYLPNERDTQ
jgi:hypothetical protein